MDQAERVRGNKVKTGVYQGEPLSLILGLGVNPFPSRFIYRTPPSVRRTNQNRAIRSMSRRVKIAHPLVAKVG